MLATDTNAETERALRDAYLLEEALVMLGAADEYEAVAQAIADGARLLARTVLVTLTVRAVRGADTLVVASGGLPPDAGGESDADHLPVAAFSLDSERFEDATLPLLHLHGAFALNRAPRDALLKRSPPMPGWRSRVRSGWPM